MKTLLFRFAAIAMGILVLAGVAYSLVDTASQTQVDAGAAVWLFFAMIFLFVFGVFSSAAGVFETIDADKEDRTLRAIFEIGPGLFLILMSVMLGVVIFQTLPEY